MQTGPIPHHSRDHRAPTASHMTTNWLGRDIFQKKYHPGIVAIITGVALIIIGCVGKNLPSILGGFTITTFGSWFIKSVSADESENANKHKGGRV
jgi:hypothetical protein